MLYFCNGRKCYYRTQLTVLLIDYNENETKNTYRLCYVPLYRKENEEQAPSITEDVFCVLVKYLCITIFMPTIACCLTSSDG